MTFSHKPASGSGRSFSRPRKDIRRPLSDLELVTLARVADTLIPPVDGRLAGSAVADFDRLASRALAILDRDFEQVVGALADLAKVPTEALFGHLEDMDRLEPARFYPLSLVVAGAYLYSAEMQAELGYPSPHANPPGMFEIADELGSGILDPVIARGPIWVG